MVADGADRRAGARAEPERTSEAGPGERDAIRAVGVLTMGDDREERMSLSMDLLFRCETMSTCIVRSS